MENSEKVDVAMDFIWVHKLDDVSLWQPFDSYADTKYLVIYNNLINGLYNTVTCVDQVTTKHGLVTHFGVEFQTEIQRHESRTGKAVIFTWYDDEFSEQQ